MSPASSAMILLLVPLSPPTGGWYTGQMILNRGLFSNTNDSRAGTGYMYTWTSGKERWKSVYFTLHPEYYLYSSANFLTYLVYPYELYILFTKRLVCQEMERLNQIQCCFTSRFSKERTICYELFLSTFFFCSSLYYPVFLFLLQFFAAKKDHFNIYLIVWTLTYYLYYYSLVRPKERGF